MPGAKPATVAAPAGAAPAAEESTKSGVITLESIGIKRIERESIYMVIIE